MAAAEQGKIPEESTEGEPRKFLTANTLSILPSRGSSRSSAACDLLSTATVVVPARASGVIPVETSINIPQHFSARTVANPSSFMTIPVQRSGSMAFRVSALFPGYDLFSAAPVKVPARGSALISLHISIVLPDNTYTSKARTVGAFNFCAQ